MISLKWDWNEALKVAKEENFEEGVKQGIEQGVKQGHTEGLIDAFKGLVKDGTLTIETAAKKMGVTVADFRKMAML